MTDLPQLQSDLVAAGGRRRRRRRVRTAGAGAVLAAAVALAVSSIDGPPEREVVPAATPSERLERAYEVFRRPARPEDRYRGRLMVRSTRVVRSRLVGRVGRVRYHLVETSGGGLCLLADAGGGGGGCGQIEYYLDGKQPIGSFSDQDGPASLVFAFPDGVEEVFVTTAGSDVREVAVRRNAIALHLPARVMSLRWTAPDGTPQKIDFRREPPLDPADFYEVLRRTDAHVNARAGATATLASRGGRVCMRLRALGDALEGCRAKVADVRRGIVVVLGAGDRRVLAAAFPDYIRLVRLRFVDGTSRRVRVRDNVLLVPDASRLASLRYRGVSDELPAGARSVVLNADAP